MADPGLPDAVAHKLVLRLQDALSGTGGSDVGWQVSVIRGTLPINAAGDIQLLKYAAGLKREHGWDLLVYLTDLPRFTGDQPLISDVDVGEGAALVSLPALGSLRVTARTLQAVLRAVRQMADGYSPDGPRQPGKVVRHSYSAGVRAKIRLMLGMVRSNRPGRLLPSLSSATAAAIGTGAFGIFYTSIWNMAAASIPLRLAGISLLSICAMTIWLIGHNGLWDRSERLGLSGRSGLDNAATVITVLLSVAAMYALLFVVLFLGSLAIISGQYLESQLRHPVGPADYARLAWLASSLGTFAGALGSSFDSNESIREATYSRRQHERRKLADDASDE
ncbi:hypothetical protein D477_018711 [Arthrobacter crystallopoietes BAB-32]|uniref:Uncharacterized protein n=2 Tax=Crystallibacter crystallopoietes TaxID=37928 RepID=N1V376_9MICC|nr:hypothetical protein D477_018711 [Arthrobacter crystallopoietes BAB-32]